MENEEAETPAIRREQARILLARVFLVLVTAQSLILLITILSDYSTNRNSVVGGYSFLRLIMEAATLLGVLLLSFITIRAYTRPDWFAGILRSADRTIITNVNSLAVAQCVLLFLAFLLSYLIFLVQSNSIPDAPYFLTMLVNRAYYILVFAAAGALELFAFLMFEYWKELRSRSRDTSRYLLILFIVTGCVFQWLTLVLKAEWIFPLGWFWTFRVRHFRTSHLIELVVLAAGLVCIQFVLGKPKRRFWNVALSLLLFYAMMISFGVAEGHGLESVRLKYFNTKLSDVARISACESHVDLLNAVREYNALFGSDFWLATKPPGTFAFYKLIGEMLTDISPKLTVGSENCFTNLSQILVIAVPLLFPLILLPISSLQRLLDDGQISRVEGFLYMSTPSVLLMMLLSDQFLYPFLFVISVLILGLSVTRKSFGLGFAAGFFAFLSTYVSFSLLPLFGLAVVWFAASILYDNASPFAIERKRLFPLIGFIAGVGVAWLAAGLLLNYDPISRYQMAFQHHRDIKHVILTLLNIGKYVILNNLEFAAWSGFPLILLFAAAVVRSLNGLAKRRATRRNVFAFSFFMAYLVTNLLGQTDGEVGRMWMFMLPVIVVLASEEAATLLQNRIRSVQFIFTLQFITAYLMFRYMDIGVVWGH